MSDDGGQAFPISRANFAQDGHMLSSDWVPGMTLRDYFAGLALEAIISSDAMLRACEMVSQTEKRSVQKQVAETAYLYADAMLKARQPPTPGAT